MREEIYLIIDNNKNTEDINKSFEGIKRHLYMANKKYGKKPMSMAQIGAVLSPLRNGKVKSINFLHYYIEDLGK